MQKTNKKDLYHILKNLMTQQETPEVIMGNTAFIVDLLTVMHTLQGISGIISVFYWSAFKSVKSLLSNYRQIMANTYLVDSI